MGDLDIESYFFKYPHNSFLLIQRRTPSRRDIDSGIISIKRFGASNAGAIRITSFINA
jgi:hypothetical protein